MSGLLDALDYLVYVVGGFIYEYDSIFSVLATFGAIGGAIAAMTQNFGLSMVIWSVTAMVHMFRVYRA